MLFENFAKETRVWWNRYLTFIYEEQQRGNLNLSGGGFVFYPNILLVTKAKDLFVAELIGAQKTFTSLKLLQHKETSIYRYLSQFDDSEPDPLIRLNAKVISFRFLCLAQEADFDDVKHRFPFIELFPSKLKRIGGKGDVCILWS